MVLGKITNLQITEHVVKYRQLSTGLSQHVQTSLDSLPDMQGWPYSWLHAQFCIPDTPTRGFLQPGEFIPHHQCRFLGASLNLRSTRVHECLKGAEVT